MSTIPTPPVLTDLSDPKQLAALNLFLKQVRDAFTGRLNTTDNTVNEIKDVPFQAPNAPSFPSPEKPKGVMFLGLMSVGDNAASVPMTAPFSWTWKRGVVTVTSLAALTGSARYSLRVLVVRG